MLLAVEIVLLAVSLIILTVVLKLRRQMLEPLTTTPIKLAKVKKALTATFLTMLLATTCYAATIYLATIISPQVEVARINGFFEFSNDNVTWVDAYDWYKVLNMSWYVRFNVTSAFIGMVNANWTLQYFGDKDWNDTNVIVSTKNFELNETHRIIYASPNGEQTNSKNWADTNGVWHQDLIPYAHFRIKIEFSQS